MVEYKQAQRGGAVGQTRDGPLSIHTLYNNLSNVGPRLLLFLNQFRVGSESCIFFTILLGLCLKRFYIHLCRNIRLIILSLISSPLSDKLLQENGFVSYKSKQTSCWFFSIRRSLKDQPWLILQALLYSCLWQLLHLKGKSRRMRTFHLFAVYQKL